MIFFLFLMENRLDISCKLSPDETICIKCQSLFSGEKKINLPSAELAQKVAKVNGLVFGDLN